MCGMKSKSTSYLILFLVFVSLASGFYIWRYNSNSGLDLQIDAPEEIMRGVPYDVMVNFTNNSGAVLQDAILTFVLPEGAAFFGSDSQKTIDNKSLGNVGAGSLIQETYKVIFLSQGEQMSLPAQAGKLKAVLAYSPAALSARFEKSQSADVNAGISGVSVEMKMPEAVVNGEEFEIVVSYRNVSEVDFSDLNLKLEYPPSFSFASATLKPDEANNIWGLGELRKNSEGEFKIKGSIIGAEKDIFDFKSFLSLRDSGQSYVIDEKSISMAISSSPLSLSVSLANGQEYVSRAGDTLNYMVSFVNNTDQNLKDVVLRAQIVGEMFDSGSLQASGNFRPADSMLIWNSANTPLLSVVQAGSAGAVSFSIKTKDAYPIRRLSDKNFSLQILAEAESKGIDSKIFSKARVETKVRGNLIVDAKGFFRDAESGILNRGPVPPKAGQATNFTIHWALRGYASDISNIEVNAPLGDNVKIIGEPKSNAGTVPFFDSQRNLVVWSVSRVQANQGVVGDPVEAVFQVEAIPFADQVGKYMILIGDTYVKGMDNFTNQEVLNNDIAVTTALPDDASVGGQGGVVQP